MLYISSLRRLVGLARRLAVNSLSVEQELFIASYI
jgi:hypothetical protein